MPGVDVVEIVDAILEKIRTANLKEIEKIEEQILSSINLDEIFGELYLRFCYRVGKAIGFRGQEKMRKTLPEETPAPSEGTDESKLGGLNTPVTTSNEAQAKESSSLSPTQEVLSELSIQDILKKAVSTAAEFVAKYSLQPGEGAMIGDPHVLDYLSAPLLSQLRDDFSQLSKEEQDRVAFSIEESEKNGQNEKLWRALLIVFQGRLVIGKNEFMLCQDNNGNLVVGYREE